MKYVPMDANERYLAFQSAPVGGNISDKISVIEQAILARIESQGLVIVPTMAVKPKADAEPVAWMMTADGYRRPPELYRTKPDFVPPISKLIPLYTHPPQADAERVALIEGLDYALGHITHIPVSHDLLRDIRAYLKGGA